MNFNKGQKVQVYSHIPKTGGTTIKHALEEDYILGENYFHFAVNGIKALVKSKGFTPFEKYINLQQFDGRNLILFGHKVNEGMFKNFPIDKVEISTILRHPYKRLVSQYFMRLNANDLDYKKSFQQFMESQTSSVCKFFISRFPSFIENPYDSFLIQARSILSCFDQIEILEDAPHSFERILSRYETQYDNSLHSNKNDRPNYAKEIGLDQIDENLYSFISNDIQLYNEVVNKQIEFNHKKPTQILRPNLWLKFLFRNSLMFRDKILPAIKEPVVLHLLDNQTEKEGISFINVIDSLCSIEDFDNLSYDLKVNLFDVFIWALLKLKKIPSYSNKGKKNIFIKIIDILTVKGTSDIQFITDPIVLEFPDENYTCQISKINYFDSIGDIENRLKYINLAMKTYPLEGLPFYKMYQYALEVEDSLIIKDCYFKLLELDSQYARHIYSTNK